jgi:hypothetical protein
MNNGVKNKVSFDFDSTLDREDVQEFAKHLIEDGLEVWVTTSRCSDEEAEKRRWNPNWNKDLWLVTERLGIPKDRVNFTAYVDKWNVLNNKGFLWHLDDDNVEIELLEENNSDCIGINVCFKDWLNECEFHLAMNSSMYNLINK